MEQKTERGWMFPVEVGGLSGQVFLLKIGVCFCLI